MGYGLDEAQGERHRGALPVRCPANPNPANPNPNPKPKPNPDPDPDPNPNPSQGERHRRAVLVRCSGAMPVYCSGVSETSARWRCASARALRTASIAVRCACCRRAACARATSCWMCPG